MTQKPPPRLRDHYADGAWYDAEYVHIGGDIRYYEQVACETDGPILELACGTGRLSFPMAATGVKVVGVDSARGMLARAEAKRAALPPSGRARLEFRYGDMRTVRFKEEFAAVVLAFNTLMHMTEDDDLLATLETARVHLEEDGLFHVDLHTPLPEISLNREPDGRYDPEEMVAPNGDRFIVTENNQYDARRQINRMWFYYQQVDRDGYDVGPEQASLLELRVLFPRELDLFFRLAGLEMVGDWDDFERSAPFSGGGGRRVIQARPRPARPGVVVP